MKTYVWMLFLLPVLLCAERAFEIDKQEYRYLDDIALSLDPDTCSGKGSNCHNYTQIYSHYFSHIKDRPLKLLEIGIYKGVGVQLWEHYFPNAELHFIDINFKTIEYFSNRSSYYCADQANPAQLLQVVDATGGQFDIIIDDGGHKMDQQILSFTTLFPHLKSGGMYIIEDLHTSYWKSDGGQGSPQQPKAGPGTTIQFLKDLVEDLNFIGARERWPGSGRCLASYDFDLSMIQHELNLYRDQIFAIHFYSSLCVIIKR